MSGHFLARIGFLLGLCALLIQFSGTIPLAMENGRSLFGSIAFYFSFFTILTNIFVVLVYAAYLRGKPAFFTKPSVRACAATSILLVMIVYITMLAGLYLPQGLILTADTLMHYVCPPLYVIWWVLFAADGSVRVKNLLRWMAYPTAYFVAICIRWMFVAEMPYPFINPDNGGWQHVGRGIVLMSTFFCAIGLAIIAADRFIGRLWR